MNRNAFLCAAMLLVAFTTGTAQSPKIEVIKDESSVTYRLVHPLHKIEATSKDVDYRVDMNVTTHEIKSVSAHVDVTTFSSGNSNRDSHAMEVIDEIDYPEASFASTSIVQHGDSLNVAGKLTFHGVTKDVVMKGTSKWSANKVVVEGDLNVSLTEFKIDRPSLLMIPVDDALSFSIVAVLGWK